MPGPERIGSDTPSCHAKDRISCQNGCIVFAGPLPLRPLQEEDVPLPGALEDDPGAVRDALEGIPGLVGHLNSCSLHSVRHCASSARLRPSILAFVHCHGQRPSPARGVGFGRPQRTGGSARPMFPRSGGSCHSENPARPAARPGPKWLPSPFLESCGMAAGCRLQTSPARKPVSSKLRKRSCQVVCG